LAVVVALLGAIIVASPDGEDDDARDTTGEEPAGGPTDNPASEPEIEAAVSEISAFVERERGLAFLAPVDVELAGEGDFQDRLLADFEEDADDLRETEVFLEGLGMVEPEVDLVEAIRSLLGAGVVGFYDPETDELVVRGTALTPYVRTTIAHELTHALDDQHLDLDRPEYDDADDEISFGFSAVVEGNARRIENAYRASLSDDERDQADEEELSLGAGIDLGDVPLVLVDLIGASYELGEPFVEELIDSGGNDALAAAFADPPRTSEQVMDPERYAAGEQRVDVPHPQVAGEVVSEGVMGQMLLLLVLADEIDADEVRDAVTGWGGDWAVAWRDGDRSCVTLTAVGDDVTETAELRQAFEDWAGEREGASVAPPGDGPFTVESCAT
jgi:hypothetical protein